MSTHWPEEAERDVLSAILAAGCVSADAGLRILRRARDTGLHPTHFGMASYGVIYEAMLRLAEDGLPVDPTSVAAEVDATHSDPMAVPRLRVLAAELAPFNAIERHSEIVRDAALRRERRRAAA